MEVQVSRTRSRNGLIGLVCFGLGMLAMWGLQQVDLRGLLSSSASTEDELARAAFEALSDGDFEDFDEYVPKLEDFEKYIARIREFGTDRDRQRVERKLEEEGGADRAMEENRARVRTSFADTIDQARRAGLDWRAAEYGGLNRDRTRIKERYGWRGGDVRFLVNFGGKTFEFELDGCLCLDGAWMVGNRIRMVRPHPGSRDLRAPLDAHEAPGVAEEPEAARTELTPALDAVEAAVTEAESPEPQVVDSPRKPRR